jgi:hypothetical protein
MRKFKSDEIKQVEDIARKVAAEILTELKKEKATQKAYKKEAE